MKIKKLIISLFILSVITTPAWATNYYVDADAAGGGDGSFSTPWDDLTDITGLSTGDDVYLNEGDTWTDQHLTVNWSGTSGNYAIIGCYSANGVFSQGNCATKPILTDNWDFVNDEAVNYELSQITVSAGQEYVRIQDIRIEEVEGRGISTNSSDSPRTTYIDIINCEVYKTSKQSIAYVYTDYGTVSDNDLSFWGMHYQELWYGNWPGGLSFTGAHNQDVLRNILHEGYGEGVMIINSDGHNVMYNKVYDTHSAGYYVDNGHDTVIAYNLGYNRTDTFYVRSKSGAATIEGITQATTAVVTYSGDDDWEDGEKVRLYRVLGMTEINGHAPVAISNVDTVENTFELTGINSSGYSAWSSGGYPNNRIIPHRYVSGGIGIDVESTDNNWDNDSYNQKIYGNLMVNTSQGIKLGAWRPGSVVQDVEIYNNTFVDTGGNFYMATDLSWGGDAIDNIIKNNISYCYSADCVHVYNEPSGGECSDAEIDWDFNYYYSESGAGAVPSGDAVGTNDVTGSAPDFAKTDWSDITSSLNASDFAADVDQCSISDMTNPSGSAVVVTCNAHGFSNGNVVDISGVNGMVEANNHAYTVASADTNTFELSGTDGDDFTAYTSGGTATYANAPWINVGVDTDNTHCTASGVPDVCCTGSGTGTCTRPEYKTLLDSENTDYNYDPISVTTILQDDYGDPDIGAIIYAAPEDDPEPSYVDSDCSNGATTYLHTGTASADGKGSCTGGNATVYTSLPNAISAVGDDNTIIMRGETWAISSTTTDYVQITQDDLIIENYTGETPIISGTALTPYAGVVGTPNYVNTINITSGTDNVTIDGITILAAPGRAILLEGATNCNIENTTVTDAFVSCYFTKGGYGHVFNNVIAESSTQVWALHNQNSSSCAQNGHTCGGTGFRYDAAMFQFKNEAHNCIVRNSIIRNSHGEGFLIGATSYNILVEYNEIYGNAKWQLYSMGNHGVVVRYNLIYGKEDNGNDLSTGAAEEWNNDGSHTSNYTTGQDTGIYVGYESWLTTEWPYLPTSNYGRASFYGNFIANCSPAIGPGAQSGVYSYYPAFWHNTIVYPKNEDADTGYGYNQGSGNSRDQRFLNNIILINSEYEVNGYVSSSMVADYNLYSKEPWQPTGMGAYLIGANDPTYATPVLAKTTGWNDSAMADGGIVESDFYITSGTSAGVDEGGPLMLVNQTSGNSNEITVDAGYADLFYGDEELTIGDGWDSDEVTLISVEKISLCTDNNTPWTCCSGEWEGTCSKLILDAAIDFENNDPVYFRHFEGTAPEIGAYEYTPSNTTDIYVDADCTDNPSTTYHPVNNTCTGGSSTVWSTINLAITDASDNTTTDTIHIRAGTYEEYLSLTDSDLADLTIKTYSGDTVQSAIIDGSGTFPNAVTYYNLIYIGNSVTGLVLDGLKITNSAGRGVYVYADDVEVKNCDISNNFHAGIGTFYVDNTSIHDNDIYGNSQVEVLHKQYSGTCYYGSAAAGGDRTHYCEGGTRRDQPAVHVKYSGSTNSHVYDNSIYLNYAAAFNIGLGSRYGLFEDNYIYGNKNSNFYVREGKGHVIRNNIIFGVGNTGLALANAEDSPHSDGTGYSCIYFNVESDGLGKIPTYNIVYGNFCANSGAGFQIGGQSVANGDDNLTYNYIYHNTFIENNSGATSISGYATYQYLKNNIWQQESNNTLFGSTPNLDFTYNLFSSTPEDSDMIDATTDPDEASPTLARTNWLTASIDSGDIVESDFYFTSDTSPGIDDGGRLTKTSGTGSSTDIIVVDDANYFTAGQEITIGSNEVTIEVVRKIVLCTASGVPDWDGCCTGDMQGSCNSLDIDTDINYSDDDPVYFRHFEGTAPDIGAYEYTDDITAPTISNPLPSGEQSCTTDPRNVTIQVTTNENATCKYDTSNVTYSSMSNTFSTTGTTSHSQSLSSLSCGSSYTRYVRCVDGNSNESNTATISFSIEESDPLSYIQIKGLNLKSVDFN